MQFFGSLFNDNKALTITLIVVAGIVGLAVLIFLYQLLFGRRLHMAGGRSRQPRLGVVDAFDLDRQRQLVLIRRDNVEHLVMIGGPNDLVIESAFVRMQPSVPVPGARDKDGITGVIAPVVPMAMPPGALNGVAPGPGSIPNIAVDIPGLAQSPSAAPTPAPHEPERPAVPPLDLTNPVPSAQPDPLAGIPAPAPLAATTASAVASRSTRSGAALFALRDDNPPAPIRRIGHASAAAHPTFLAADPHGNDAAPTALVGIASSPLGAPVAGDVGGVPPPRAARAAPCGRAGHAAAGECEGRHGGAGDRPGARQRPGQ